MYRSLDATRITDTVSLLERRVAERFPGSGLSKVAAEVTGVAQQAMKVTAEIDRPNLLLRAGGWTPVATWDDADPGFALILAEATEFRSAP